MGIKSVNYKTHKLSVTASILAALTLSGCGGGSNTNTDIKAVDTSAPVSDWVMVWNDEFDGAGIDANKWTHEVNCAGGGNQEKQCYTDSDENSFVADGMLNIVAKPTSESVDTGLPLPYTSARLVTKNKGDFRYGRIEMRAKVPFGQGSWPAFWMLPTDEVYGGWPKSGEIDIFESVNLGVVSEEGVEERNIYGTLHYGRDFPNNESSGQPYLLPNGVNPSDGFHTYAIEWQEGEIRWYMDGYLYATQMASEVRFNSKDEAVGLIHRGWFAEYFDIATGEQQVFWDSSPFDQDFHLILNFAVGGSWPENVNNLGIDESAFAGGQAFQIDYVRVYECSIDPDTGAGCETVRGGYKDENTLVEGKAPTPTPPTPDVAVPITIFDDAENPLWKLWDCCGGTTPAVVTDDAEHGAVAEFQILDNAGTVLGFNSRPDVSEGGTPFNASAMLTTGNLSFEMKVVNAPTSDTTWLLKVEGDNNTSFAEVALNTSVEGADPVTGQWQTYTFPLQALSDAGLDISAIDVIMIFPAWQTGEGAIYRVDNVEIAEPGGQVFPELVLFEDQANPDWPLWDCCGGTTPTEEMDDADHGVVAEFSILNNDGTVLGFKPADGSGINFDASALLTDGVVQFEMKVVNAPTSPDAVWKFKIEGDGATSAVEVDLSTGNGGADPVTGEWATYTFAISDLADAGLDISVIDVLMIFPAWQTGEGAIYRVDNAKIFNPNATSGPTGPREVVFADAESGNWPLWDCCGGTTPTVETDDADHGAVAEFQILNNDGTVLGFNSRLPDDGAPFDASALLTTGTLSFEMKVVSPPTADTTWLLKVEADNNTSFAEVALNTSTEGANPVTGEWQTYTFPLSALSDAGLDISAIDVIMIFPAWQTGEGAVYRVDNLVIGNPGDTGQAQDGNSLVTFFKDDANAEWPLWDCCGGTTPTVAADDADHGATAEFQILDNAGTVLGFYSRDAGSPVDASAYLTTGTLTFEMKIVTPPSGGDTNWLLKVEADNNTSFAEVNLNTSNEGQDPVVGQWQTYTFDLLALSDAGLDLSAIDVVMVFPAWQTGGGAIYRIDNAMITTN
ncbi:glycoside hydrolase family 16 protein [Aliiglaciecola sp. M165]|nr:glycoside hydrolase family 16 protein [Aliiglaciecola sp. M165]